MGSLVSKYAISMKFGSQHFSTYIHLYMCFIQFSIPPLHNYIFHSCFHTFCHSAIPIFHYILLLVCYTGHLMLYKPHIQPCMTWYVFCMYLIRSRKEKLKLVCLVRINTVHTIGRTPIMLSPQLVHETPKRGKQKGETPTIIIVYITILQV